jgi:hypothetical protein
VASCRARSRRALTARNAINNTTSTMAPPIPAAIGTINLKFDCEVAGDVVGDVVGDDAHVSTCSSVRDPTQVSPTAGHASQQAWAKMKSPNTIVMPESVRIPPVTTQHKLENRLEQPSEQPPSQVSHLHPRYNTWYEMATLWERPTMSNNVHAADWGPSTRTTSQKT